MRRVPTIDNVDKCDGCIFHNAQEACTMPFEKYTNKNGWNPRECVHYGLGGDMFARINYIYLKGLDISKETVII
jgi:hypothetical protein